MLPLTTPRTVARSVLVLAALSAAGILNGCGSADNDVSESVASSGSALTTLPEARCTLLAGTDKLNLQADQTGIRQGGGYTGPDPNVLGFQQAIRAIGPAPYYTLSLGSNVSWYAMDVTNLPASAVKSVVASYKNVAPVFSGYFSCTYLWGDYYLPPGHPRPYVPHYIGVYDPRACTSCDQ